MLISEVDGVAIVTGLGCTRRSSAITVVHFHDGTHLMTLNGHSKIILSLIPLFPECLAPHHRSKQAA